MKAEENEKEEEEGEEKGYIYIYQNKLCIYILYSYFFSRCAKL